MSTIRQRYSAYSPFWFCTIIVGIYVAQKWGTEVPSFAFWLPLCFLFICQDNLALRRRVEELERHVRP